jgi:hypothetical protein
VSAPADELTVEERELLDLLARQVCERRLETPAIFMLESVKPLNFVGAQVMHFFAPLVTPFYGGPYYDRLARLLEKRGAIEALIVRIEAGAK